ncbi:MAG TPA: glycoside hydrolase family 140 protein [Anaerolineaceae bacterium]
MNRLQRILVHPEGRFLMTEDGNPFFWLGDTAWELFHRLTLEEADYYFRTRTAQMFNVVQAVILAEFRGLTEPNRYGALPLKNSDPEQPDENYFETVDKMILQAEKYGLYIGILPTWGDKVFPAWAKDVKPIFNERNAFQYGRFLGNRYRDQSNIIWILGGDRPPVHEGCDDRNIWRAMAAGINSGSGMRVIKTYHPMGRTSSSTHLHGESWLDMNMIQSGHGSGRDSDCWEMIAQDYIKIPIKPVLDGEPNYEDHPVNPWPVWNPSNGYYRDDDVRKQLYRSVFAGGCGVTYGHHSVWQMASENYEPVNHSQMTWRDALHRPGANQVQYLRRLMESRPYFSRVPDQSILAQDAGILGKHIQVTKDRNGKYVMVYLPGPDKIRVRTGYIQGDKIRAWWYSTKTGIALEIGKIIKTETSEFISPDDGGDWVLVLDDLRENFPAPGHLEL